MQKKTRFPTPKERLKIVSNIPLPNPRRSNIQPLPLTEMKIGDSFEVGIGLPNDFATIRQRLSRYQKRNPPVRFSMQTINQHRVRVFRVEDYQQV